MRIRAGNPRVFNAFYQQSPAAPEDALFPRPMLESCRNPLRDLGEPKWDRMDVARVASFDPGQAKYGAAWLMDVKLGTEEYELAVLDGRRKKGLGPEDIWQLLQEWEEHLGPLDYFIPEKNSFYWFNAHPMADWCRQKGINMQPQFTGINKGSMQLGVESLSADFAMERIDFPSKSLAAKKLTDTFFDEAEVYPEGRTDDQVMALWFPKPYFKTLRRRWSGQTVRTRWHQLSGVQGGWK